MKKWYEWMLVLAYIGMFVLFVALNFAPGQQEGLANLVVNALMFIIVGIIFLCTGFGCFKPMNSMMDELTYATEKIRTDALNTHSYLWKPYRTNNVELFENNTLKKLLQDFIFTLNRTNNAENVFYRPSIDEFINEDLVDRTMHRNELNQIPGVLTGLGILGTFIGLSLGLQSFNTGTTAEMTNSIEPLMNGIKVAFHTSIYGMVFSLVFNMVYKKKLYDAECCVNDFVDTFKKYVLPDTTNDGMNKLIALQESQLASIEHISADISADMATILEPHFNHLRDVIVDFQNMATRNQADAMNQILENLKTLMNNYLGTAFNKVSATVDEQYDMQQKNADTMKMILSETGKGISDLHKVTTETQNLLASIDNYNSSVLNLQNEIRKTISVLDTQAQASQSCVSQELNTLKEQDKLLTGFKNSIDQLAMDMKFSNDQISDSLTDIADTLYSIKRITEAKGRK